MKRNKKENKEKKGISLIVLIITIIIMIILAAALLLSINSSNVVNKASEAKTKSDIASARVVAETAWAEWLLMSDAEKEEAALSHNFSEYAADNLEKAGLSTSAGAYADLIGMEIGDEVEYVLEPAPAFEWKYAGVDDNGNVILIADGLMQYGLNFEGAAYIGGAEDLNTLCNQEYSSAYGDARSINVDDVNRILGANPVITYQDTYDDDDRQLLSPKTIGELVKEGQAEFIDGYNYTPDGTDISNYKVNYYWYEGITYKPSSTQEYKLIFGNVEGSNAINYTLASSFVDAYFRWRLCKFRSTLCP